MTDKEKIRELIEKRYEYWKEKEFNSHSIESEIRMSECQHLLLMINSLQEEPISEGLEEASKNHAAERFRVTRDRELAEKCKWSFKAGAQWQKKKDNILSEKNVSSIWHDASDPHDENKLLIVKLISGQVALYRGSFNNAERDFGICEATELDSEPKGIIEEWCYFNDILPDNK